MPINKSTSFNNIEIFNTEVYELVFHKASKDICRDIKYLTINNIKVSDSGVNIMENVKNIALNLVELHRHTIKIVSGFSLPSYLTESIDFALQQLYNYFINICADKFIFNLSSDKTYTKGDLDIYLDKIMNKFGVEKDEFFNDFSLNQEPLILNIFRKEL